MQYYYNCYVILKLVHYYIVQLWKRRLNTATEEMKVKPGEVFRICYYSLCVLESCQGTVNILKPHKSKLHRVKSEIEGIHFVVAGRSIHWSGKWLSDHAREGVHYMVVFHRAWSTVFHNCPKKEQCEGRNLIFMDPCIVVWLSRNTKKMQLVIEFIIPKFIEGSTCSERHTAHHQEL